MAKSSNIVPLIILIIVVAILAVVGFVVYSIAHDVGHKTRQKLERKNVSFSKGGMKVGVKHVSQEQQEDAAQRYQHCRALKTNAKLIELPCSVITNIWNNASFPAYKSPVLGWNQTNKTPTPGAEKRNP